MKKCNILLLILLLVIGFASVSTSLILNGNVTIGVKNDDFDVIFVSALLDGENSSNVIISENKKEITFISNKLTSLGDQARLDYQVKNNSTQYGAKVTINCNIQGNEYVSIKHEFDGQIASINNLVNMEAQEIKSGYINAELVKTYVGADDSIAITCKIVANPTPKDNIVDYVPYVYKDKVLNGADPVLKDELIPVSIANDGTVTIANTESKWYSYETKEWANAVILEDGVTYNVGDVIPEDKIESYFVWVPRYKYLIFDEGNYTEAIEGKPLDASIAKEIKIEFESKDISPSTGSTKDTWLTHPAFTNFDINGIWVGKFETGYQDAKNKEEAQVNAIDSSRVIVKPNIYSWRYNAVANMFKTAYNYKRNLDSHMMKNTEWGAVAYLSHSKYGINTEINVNNNSDYLTGYSAVEGTDQSNYPGTYGTDATKTLAYNTPTGYKASTTGNITGIYDMSGGGWEYVAAYSGLGSSGLISTELTQYAKYLDVYESDSTITTYNKRILGDATGEIGPFYYYKDRDDEQRFHNNWFADYSDFVDSSYSWFIRGGHYAHGVLASQFCFARGNGDVSGDAGSRLVLAI